MRSATAGECAELDLSGLEIRPGLINAHDHLQFALFPRLGSGPYPNATAWARDIYHPEQEPVRSHLRVPKRLRLFWGGLRNLLCGVTTVGHHDPCDPAFDDDFPVEVIRHWGWAHSLEFSPDVRERFEATPPGAPFVIHLGEGTDDDASQEVFRLHELGALGPRTVLVHAVGLNRQGWDLVAQVGASVIWCPRSNLFTLGRTLDLDAIPRGVPVALGSDSPLTAEGDFLDEIEFVRTSMGAPDSLARRLAGESAALFLRLSSRPEDWIAAQGFGAPPELVVRKGRILLISPQRAASLPSELREEFFPLYVEGRPRVLVRWNTPLLLRETAEFLDGPQIRLAGRVVDAAWPRLSHHGSTW
jgi:cytosine/adenosine deaminase-related metal-dependent hydrolase